MNVSNDLRLGVVLLNLGGPTASNAVKPFLMNLFTDPDIIKLGGGVRQKLLAKFIVARRLKEVTHRYQAISACLKGCEGNALCPNRLAGVVSNCCSPINPLTELQRHSLEKQLHGLLPEHFVRVYTAMRYWEPSTEKIMQQLVEDQVSHVVLLPLYPQFSWTTSGSSFAEWYRVKKLLGFQNRWQECAVKDYHKNPDFLNAVNARIDEALAPFSAEVRAKTHLVFSAHGTPMSEVRSGDPYTLQMRATVDAIMANRHPQEEHWLSYQSRVGPAQWTKPSTEVLVKRLLNYGIKNLLMVPVAFVTDHIETVMELNIELREEVEHMGVENLTVTKGLNDHPYFIKALADEVIAKIAYGLDNSTEWEMSTRIENAKI
jgi:protoporphyrin/coproporphyrin ferrochelatase